VMHIEPPPVDRGASAWHASASARSWTFFAPRRRASTQESQEETDMSEEGSCSTGVVVCRGPVADWRCLRPAPARPELIGEKRCELRDKWAKPRRPAASWMLRRLNWPPR
jgi:hypothetical protein